MASCPGASAVIWKLGVVVAPPCARRPGALSSNCPAWVRAFSEAMALVDRKGRLDSVEGLAVELQADARILIQALATNLYAGWQPNGAQEGARNQTGPRTSGPVRAPSGPLGYPRYSHPASNQLGYLNFYTCWLNPNISSPLQDDRFVV